MSDESSAVLHPNVKNISSQRFHRLVVLRYAGVGHWLCQCDCGNKTKIKTSKLKTGHTQSCGCRQKEEAAQRCRDRATHGFSRSVRRHPIYHSWDGLKKRCQNSKIIGYKNWGGRGITVCERWQKFSNFLEDMGPTWKPRLTIERIDNSGPYCKKNCKWATRKEQNRNRRDNRHLEFNGETMVISAWAERLRMYPSTIWLRLSAGWSVQETLTVPPRKRPKKYDQA